MNNLILKILHIITFFYFLYVGKILSSVPSEIAGGVQGI